MRVADFRSPGKTNLQFVTPDHAWQWQPTRLVHDPNPPITLESLAFDIMTAAGLSTATLTLNTPLSLGTLTSVGSSTAFMVNLATAAATKGNVIIILIN